VLSQNRAEKAQKENVFKDEIVPVTVKAKKGTNITDTHRYIINESVHRKAPLLGFVFQKFIYSYCTSCVYVSF